MAGYFTYFLLFISLYFEVFLLVSFIDGRRRRPKALAQVAAKEFARTVAIIVPCFNEERGIAGTLRSLLALDYPTHLFEIVVVDDGSTDKTLEIAKAVANEAGRQGISDEDLCESPAGRNSLPTRARIRVFHKENGGKHTAMNLGLSKTSADFVGCLDADSIVAPDALRRIVPIFDDARVGAVTPGIHVKEPKTLLQHMQNVEYRLAVFNRFVLSAIGSAFITPGPFSVFRASVVRETGGWREAHMTEDLELALRMQDNGFLIANAPAAIVHTSTPATVPRLFRQRVRWTYGFLRNAIDYRHMLGNRSYGNLGLYILPAAVVSIGAALYFFFRILYGLGYSLYHEILWVSLTGMFPQFSFDMFFINTSAMMFLILAALGLILVLIATGSKIGTGSGRPPYATPLFLFVYGFLVPLWLGMAVLRATFKTGVRWR